ncbi:hypothetical protein VF21_00101 [Pseudogymnoascus sp. 05NY08]|nr:hypothetical protein VF21_00194 [Pseudogymnoascus sp. 05NY08]OBT80886.1 hypothetical protein VF21_00101 [Pseudogymnoascus sp. 05NY08]
MPSRERETSVGAANALTPGSLKRHKTLPHPKRDRSTETYYSSPPSTATQTMSVDSDVSPPSTSSYDLSPRTLKHASKRIGLPDLPPTPPAHSRNSSDETQTPAVPFGANGTAADSSTPNTPPNVHSPPTPDFTPPRNPRRASLMRPAPSERNSSSRAESFRTARENQSLEEIRSAFTPGEATPMDPEPLYVGLGLDLDVDRRRTPTPVLRQKFSFEDEEFRRFDGDWNVTDRVDYKQRYRRDDDLMRNVTVRRGKARKPYRFDESPVMQEVRVDCPVAPTNATIHLQEFGLGNGTSDMVKDVSSADTLRGTEVNRQLWPEKARAESSPAPDVRRFSSMSGKSNATTIGAVVVVNSPPTQRRTLRHTKKQYGLRDFTPPGLPTAPAVTNRQPNGASEVASRIINRSNGSSRPNHNSLNSVNSNATTTASTRSRRRILSEGAIPVVVVPERRSSAKTAQAPSLRSASSRNTRKSVSLQSAPLSQSAGSNIPVTIEQPTIRQRRMSDSATSRVQSERSTDGPPVIPQRRSSLSAPTSRNTSRSGSLTAESLRAHNAIQAVEAAKLAALAPLPPAVPPKDIAPLGNTLTVDTNGDPFFGQRLSAQVTPFSQSSHDTHGTALEISEALAINLYPHQNRSVLMVQHGPLQPRSAPKGSPIHLRTSSLPLPTDPDPMTPPQRGHPLEMEADSPLRNPRDPPQPPLIKFIPPTPAAVSPDDDSKQLGHDFLSGEANTISAVPPERRPSLLQRALSTHRRESISISTILPRRFSLGRQPKNSVDTASPHTYPTVSDQPADTSRLHPFWRPARFWDDLDSDDEYSDDEWDDPNYYPPSANVHPALAAPKRGLSSVLKRTFSIMPARDREIGFGAPRRTIRRSGSGNLRVVQRNNGSVESVALGEYVRFASARQGMRNSSAPVEGMSGSDSRMSRERMRDVGFGRWNFKVGVRWVSVSGVERWAERRRERRREGLRRSISGPRGVRDGVEDVLRGRVEGGARAD